MVAVIYVIYEKCLFKRGPNYQLFTDIWTGFWGSCSSQILMNACIINFIVKMFPSPV